MSTFGCMLFSSVVGHDEVKKHLINEVRNDRVSHAQLFSAKEGTGGLPMALAFARYLMCENPTATDSCNQCSACLKMDHLAHPDVHFSFPVILKSKKVQISDDVLPEWRETLRNNPYTSCTDWTISMGGENKQGVIGTSESREIIRKLTLKSFEGGYKIMLIWRPEFMNATASNKLLKILEEPPQKTVFLLVAESLEPMLPTILSRTQIVKLGRVKPNDVVRALMEREGVSEAEAQKAAAFSEGNYSIAREYLHHLAEGDSDFSRFSEWMRICYKRNVPMAIKWTEEMAACGREIQKRFVKYSLHMVRQCIVRNYAGAQLTHLYGEEEGFAGKFAPFINQGNVVPLTEVLDQAYYDISRNANSKILFLDVSFKIFKLLKQ